MPKMLQVRNVPDDVHDELRRRARAAGMSLSDFTLHELRRLTSRPSMADFLDDAAAGVRSPLTVADARASVAFERPAG